MRVLYVEDNFTDVDLARRHLARYAPHIQLEVATTYHDAVAQLEKSLEQHGLFDLVLTDVRLPDGDGLRLLSHVRSRRLRLPVVVLTGSGNEEMAVAALKGGADDYLTKREGYLERLPGVLETALQRFHEAASHRRGPLSVLYAEHNLADIDLTRRFLARYAPDIQLDVIHTGPEVLQTFIYSDAGTGYDLLLLDYRLPGMNALDVVKELEHAGKLKIPVVLVTGQGDEEVAVQALRLGIADYLVKNPGYLFQLPRTLENTYNQRQLELERAALRESEQRYRMLFERAPVVIYTKDRDGQYTSINALGVEAIGQNPIGLTDEQLYPPNYVAEYRAHDQDVMRTRTEKMRQEHVVTAHGERIFLARKTPLIDNQGEVTGVFGISLDITERIRAEEDRREHEQRFGQLAAHIDQVFWLLETATDRLLFISPAYESIWGRSCDSAYADSASIGQAILADDRQHFQEAQARTLEGHAAEAEFRVQRPDGGLAWIACQMFPVFDESGAIYRIAGTARDVTDRRREQEHLQQQERLATVGQMAAGIAHDFNNILAVIMLYTQMLQLTVQSSLQQRHLNTIYQQAQHAANLVEQILDFSRRSTLERVTMDLCPFVKEMVKLWQRTLPESVTIHLATPDEPLAVSADPARLQQALTNVAINARDAMPAGGDLILSLQGLTVEDEDMAPVPEMTPGKWVAITVADSGVGIPDEVLPHIFDPFFTTKPPGQGTGLGLAQVYGIVRQLDGQVRVESQVDRGTRFTLYLPVLDRPSVAEETSVPAPPRGAGETILLVEDEDALRKAMYEMLSTLGYRVLTAENGHRAHDLFVEHHDAISLLVSDLVMPDMSGLELHALLQQEPLNGLPLRLLLVTGYPLKDDDKLTIEHGLVDWIQKPFAMETLARRVAMALNEQDTAG